MQKGPRFNFLSWLLVSDLILLSSCVESDNVRSDSSLPKPEWAISAGEDQYGYWAKLKINNCVQIMRRILPGKYLMGSPIQEQQEAIEKGGENPTVPMEVQHEVTLTNEFWISDSSCTQELWMSIMGKNPSAFKGDNLRPVEQVSYPMAQEFLEKLNKLCRGKYFLLPTEAQREYACRAGTMSPFPGKSLDDIGWYFLNSGSIWSEPKSHAVKQKTPNNWGLYDMNGNVMEWCSDWYGPYQIEAAIDPIGAFIGDERVVRGGDWRVNSWSCRSASRYSEPPNFNGNYIGFRFIAMSNNNKN